MVKSIKLDEIVEKVGIRARQTVLSSTVNCYNLCS